MERSVANTPTCFYPFHSTVVDDSIGAWSRSWRAILGELFGTMLFTFASGSAVVATHTTGDTPVGDVLVVSLVSGLAYMVLVFNFWNISGGHLNPAVTWGALITRRIGVMKGVAYIVAQILGAILGAILVVGSTPQTDQGRIGMFIWSDNLTSFNALLLETVVTFFLVHTVFSVSFDPVGMGRLAPLAIGFVQTMGYLITWRFTGPTSNPARTLGIAIVTGVYNHQWVYWIGPLIGSTCAALLYTLIFMTRPVREEELVRAVRDEHMHHYPDGSKFASVAHTNTLFMDERTPLVVPSGIASV